MYSLCFMMQDCHSAVLQSINRRNVMCQHVVLHLSVAHVDV